MNTQPQEAPMNQPRPPLAPDLFGAIEQAEQELDETLRKLKDGEAANGTTGIKRAKLILGDARAREREKAGARA